MAYTLSFPSPADGKTNARLLQEAIDKHRDVTVEKAGTYDIAGTILLPDHTHLTFAPGVILRRQKDENAGYFFANREFASGRGNADLSVTGLTVLCNGVESAAGTLVPRLAELYEAGEDALNRAFAGVVPGLRAHLAFRGVKDLTVRDLTIPDLADWDYGVQVTSFEHAVLEDIRISGNKDGVHFGPGRDFVLRRGFFRTKDDPIALNADDYSPSGAEIGKISDGLIEDCVDLSQEHTYGYFIRFHLGAAVDWQKGMEIRHSDSVICGGRFYRAFMPSDGSRAVSRTMPTHEEGFRVLDGIAWYRTHRGLDGLPYEASVENVLLRDLRLEKGRDGAVIAYLSDNQYHRSWREGAPVPKIKNVTFENVSVRAKVNRAFWICAPTENLILRASDLGGASVCFEQGSCGLGGFPASFTLDSVRRFRLEDSLAFSDGKAEYPVKY